MYFVPRQAVRSPIPPGNPNADLDEHLLLFNENEFRSFDDYFSYDFSSSLNFQLFDSSAFFDNYTTDPLPLQATAVQQSTFSTNPTQAGYHLPQQDTRVTSQEDSSHIVPFQAASIPEPKQSQQGLQPNGASNLKSKEIQREDNSNSPESTDSSDSNSSRDSQKRKLADMQSFPIILDNHLQASEKKRKNFDEKTRKKVALMRKIKPCKRCAIHKIACEPSGPCTACLNALGSLSLATRFCHRRTLSELRFDGGYDWLYSKFNSTFLSKELQRYHGIEMEISLELDHLEEGEGHRYPLLIRVQEYTNEAATPLHNVFARRIKSPETSIYDSNTAQFFDVQSARYAITANTLPTVEDMVTWARVDLTTAYGDPALRFAHSLAEFMDQYCQQEPKLPLVALLRHCSRLMSLVHCWRCRKTVSSFSITNTQSTQNYLSLAACSQLLLIVKEGIREAEFEILDSLESHLYSSKGPGQRNAIPLWACLWSLILMYRDRMASYNQYLPQTLPAYSAAFELMSATKHLYDIATAHYAVLFNPSTPLHLDCFVDGNFDLLGRNEVLRSAFDTARIEVFNFYNAHTHFIDQDKHLREDIIAKEQRFVQRL